MTLTPPDSPGGWWVTEDRWASPAAHAEFMRRHGEAYTALDRACEELTTDEQRLG